MNYSRLVSNFISLAQIDSPTGEEKEISDYLVNFLKENQLVDLVKQDEFGNVYGYKEGWGKPVFLSAHMDTVEPGRGINPIVEDGYIKSDGTTILGADDKVGLSTILEALFKIKDSQNHRPVEIVFTVSEEVGNMGAIQFDISLLKAKEGFCFDYSDEVGKIIISSPFYERFDIEIKGKTTHSSSPHQGINVTKAMAHLLSNLEYGQVEDGVLLNIGYFQGGHVRNSVPGAVSLKGEIRALKKDLLQKYKDLIVENLKDIEKYGVKTEVGFVYENGGYILKETDDLVVVAKNALKNLGIEPIMEETWGVSDVNIYFERGLTCLNLSNGVENAHTTEERIQISEFEKTVSLILELVKPNQ